VDNTQNIISFCTGYGGIELGLRRACVDVRTVCNVEIETLEQLMGLPIGWTDLGSWATESSHKQQN